VKAKPSHVLQILDESEVKVTIAWLTGDKPAARNLMRGMSKEALVDLAMTLGGLIGEVAVIRSQIQGSTPGPVTSKPGGGNGGSGVAGEGVSGGQRAHPFAAE
jgi:hypothetical protein